MRLYSSPALFGFSLSVLCCFVACANQTTATPTPIPVSAQSTGDELSLGALELIQESIQVPDDWTIKSIGMPAVEDLPPEAWVFPLDALSFITEDNEPEASRSGAYSFILLYPETQIARDVYRAFSQYGLVEGSDVDPDQVVEDGVIDRISTALSLGAPNKQVIQVTILSCRAVLRYNIIRHIDSTTPIEKLAASQRATAQAVRNATCED